MYVLVQHQTSTSQLLVQIHVSIETSSLQLSVPTSFEAYYLRNFSRSGTDIKTFRSSPFRRKVNEVKIYILTYIVEKIFKRDTFRIRHFVTFFEGLNNKKNYNY